MQERTVGDRFTEFMAEYEPKLRHTLTSAFGPEVGVEAVAEAFAYGWEHWDRVRAMENPIGYLYVVGRDRARRMSRVRPLRLPLASEVDVPWVEPALMTALMSLPERERMVVLLHHGYGLSMSKVAETLGIAKSTVQTHSERGMRVLRRRLGVVA